MKKTFFILVALLTAGHLQAQVTKGSIALTGNVGYSESNTSTDKTQNDTEHDLKSNEYSISPSVGYFITDNLEIGTKLFHYRNSVINPSTIELTRNQQKGVSVYARQYKFLTEKLAVHATLSAGISKSNYHSHDYIFNADMPEQISIETVNTSSFTAALSPGLTFFASKNIGLNLSMGALAYTRYKHDSRNITPDTSANTSKENTLALDFSSMNLNMGLSYFFGR